MHEGLNVEQKLVTGRTGVGVKRISGHGAEYIYIIRSRAGTKAGGQTLMSVVDREGQTVCLASASLAQFSLDQDSV